MTGREEVTRQLAAWAKELAPLAEAVIERGANAAEEFEDARAHLEGQVEEFIRTNSAAKAMARTEAQAKLLPIFLVNAAIVEAGVNAYMDDEGTVNPAKREGWRNGMDALGAFYKSNEQRATEQTRKILMQLGVSPGNIQI